jgi:hypothetical protein
MSAKHQRIWIGEVLLVRSACACLPVGHWPHIQTQMLLSSSYTTRSVRQ